VPTRLAQWDLVLLIPNSSVPGEEISRETQNQETDRDKKFVSSHINPAIYFTLGNITITR